MLGQNLQAQNSDNQFKKFKFQQKKSLKTQFSYHPIFTLYANYAILFVVREEGLTKAFALFSQSKLIKTLILIDLQQLMLPILTFMEKSRYLAFVHKCNQIVICELNQTFQFTNCQEFQAHSKEIISLSTNEGQDLLISGSFDGKIKFYKKDNLSWSHLYTIDAEMSARNFSLNAQETKLIVCEPLRGIIKIFELQSNFQWTINQTLRTDGEFICFINDNQFIVQYHKDGKYLGIYNYDEQKKLYIYSESFPLSYNQFAIRAGISFPPQFIKEKNILIVKQSGCIDFFQIDQEGNYRKQQTNKFDTIALDGKVTNNGISLVNIHGFSGQFYLSIYQSLE